MHECIRFFIFVTEYVTTSLSLPFRTVLSVDGGMLSSTSVFIFRKKTTYRDLDLAASDSYLRKYKIVVAKNYFLTPQWMTT